MNTKTLALLTLLIPLQAAAVYTSEQTTLPTTSENVSPNTSPSTSFNGNSEIYPTFPQQKSIFKNPHFLTQFTIGVAANVFSHSNVQSKMWANKVGLACGLATHLFLNSSYGKSVVRYITKEEAADRHNDNKCIFLSGLGTSCLGYGAGASAGALARFGYDTAWQWWAARANEQFRLAVELIDKENCLPFPVSRMYFGDKASFAALSNIDIFSGKEWSHITKTSWERSIKPYVQARGIKYETTISSNYPDTRIWLSNSALKSWVTSIVTHLEKVTQPVAKTELAGIMSNETLAKFRHNKQHVDAAVKQILEALL